MIVVFDEISVKNTLVVEYTEHWSNLQTLIMLSELSHCICNLRKQEILPITLEAP